MNAAVNHQGLCNGRIKTAKEESQWAAIKTHALLSSDEKIKNKERLFNTVETSDFPLVPKNANPRVNIYSRREENAHTCALM